jgi:hypothetical protein
VRCGAGISATWRPCHNRGVDALADPPALVALAARHGATLTTSHQRLDDRSGTQQVEVRIASRLDVDGHGVTVELRGAVDADVAAHRRPARYRATVTMFASRAQSLWLRVGRGDQGEAYSLRPRLDWLAYVLRPSLRTGDGDFDGRFRVETRGRGTALAWLDHDVRAAMIAADDGALGGVQLTVLRSEVTVGATIESHDTAGLAALVRAAVAIADVPDRQVARWRQATTDPEARLVGRWAPDSGFELIWRERGVELRADVAYATDGDGGTEPWLRTRIRAAWDGAPFVLVHGDLSRRRRPRFASGLHRADPPWTGTPWRLAVGDRSRAPGLVAIQGDLERVGAVAVTGSDGVVTAIVPGVDLGERWSAAGALVAALSAGARPAASPYR